MKHKRKRLRFKLFRMKCSLEKVFDFEGYAVIVYSVRMRLFGCVSYERLKFKKIKNKDKAMNPVFSNDFAEMFLN